MNAGLIGLPAVLSPNGGFPGFIDWQSISDGLTAWVNGSIRAWYDFCGWVYSSLIQVVLQTPEVLINNPAVRELWWAFVTVAIGMLAVLCIVEAIKRIFGYSNENLLGLIGKTAVAFSGLAFLIPGMTYGLSFLNKFVKYFVGMAHAHMDPAKYFSENVADLALNSGFGLLVSIIFLVLFLYHMLSLIFQYGRRWFDIIMATVISPLAFGASIFDSTRHYFTSWWNNVIRLYMIQAVHAVYISILAMIIIAPQALGDSVSVMIKMVLLVGALWRMAKPHKMAGPIESNGSMIQDIMKGVGKWSKFTNVKRFITRK